MNPHPTNQRPALPSPGVSRRLSWARQGGPAPVPGPPPSSGPGGPLFGRQVRQGMFGHVWARCGRAGLGEVRQGRVWQVRYGGPW